MARSRKREMADHIEEPDDSGEEAKAPKKDPTEPVRYEKAPEEVSVRVARVMSKWHKELHNAGVTVACEFAIAGRNSKGVKPAIMVRGHAQVAKIKRNNIHARLEGASDALLTIDMEAFGGMNAAKQDALIDNMLACLLVKREGNAPDGEVEIDTDDRPKLKVKHYDSVIEIHSDVLARHGDSMPNAPTIRKLVDDCRQLSLFPSSLAV